jgi:hypothetical protein
MKNKPEYILCSAIWYKDLDLNNYPTIPKEQYLPVNVETGIVFCGHRHVQCLRLMNIITGKKQHEVGDELQGFLTNKNRFVDRVEAAEIALKSNQIEKPLTRLFSEDVW